MDQGSRTRSRGIALAAIGVTLLATGSVRFANAETPATDATVTVPLAPSRILDTRSGLGAPATPLGPGESLDLQVTGAAGVPVGAVGVLLNVTADGATEQTYLTVWPTGDTRPEASSLNPAPGQPVPNFIEAKLGADGKLSIFNFTGTVNVIADVAGYQVPVSSVAGLPAGTVGPQGPAGPRGPSAWDVVPPGVTVTGAASWQDLVPATHQATETATIGARLPVALNANTIGMKNFTGVEPSDVDPDCTGSSQNPTAPPGQLCVYLSGTSGTVSGIQTFPNGAYGSFLIRWTSGTDSTETGVGIVWVYTAPI